MDDMSIHSSGEPKTRGQRLSLSPFQQYRQRSKLDKNPTESYGSFISLRQEPVQSGRIRSGIDLYSAYIGDSTKNHNTWEYI